MCKDNSTYRADKFESCEEWRWENIFFGACFGLAFYYFLGLWAGEIMYMVDLDVELDFKIQVHSYQAFIRKMVLYSPSVLFGIV